MGAARGWVGEVEGWVALGWVAAGWVAAAKAVVGEGEGRAEAGEDCGEPR